MFIDQQECTGCGVCVPHCPVGAISEQEGVAAIDFDGCVECAVCLRYAGCPTDAIHESPETAEWPRVIRREFSDPLTPNRSTGRRGRGTGGVKTIDVTGETKVGEICVGLEFGRPGMGTVLTDVEKMSVALAEIGVRFVSGTPLASLMPDPENGQIRPDVRDERVLSANLEFHTTPDRLREIVPLVRRVAGQVDTVISWGVTVRLGDDGSIPIMGDLRGLGLTPRPNAKINLGMGRPLVEG